jgi:outer membrane protein assembly factor BamB
MNKVIGAAAGSILSLLLSTAVCAQDENQYLFNGEHSIRLAADVEAGDLHTLHGSIHIGERSKVGDVKTIDGTVVLAKGSRANSVRSLDGAIQLEEDAKLVHGVSTAGGSIVLDDHADVAGRVTTADGEIRLKNAHVSGGIVTRRGNINVGSGSHVENGIRVKRSFCLCINAGLVSNPRVVIGPGAVVRGSLIFERKVTLYVSDMATIGDVVGATSVRFSGPTPE